MEAGYLNFHDAEHFSEFELPLDQHDLLYDSESSLMAIVDTDFDYIERMDPSGLWGTEQELNGDMAVLPDSGVASDMPKIDTIKEDFAKVLSDWQEHIGYMQASDLEEDIDMSALNIHLSEKIHGELPENIFQNEIGHSPEKKYVPIVRPQEKVSSSFPLVDLKPILSNFTILPDEILQLKSPIKKEFSPIKYKMKMKDAPIINNHFPLDENCSAMDIEDCIDIETVPEHESVLEAGDVKSLLEQFEASEVVMAQSAIKTELELESCNISKSINNKEHTDQSKQTLLIKTSKTVDSKFHKNIRDSLPKEVIDRIKASGRRKVIPVISPKAHPTKSNRNNRSNSSTTSYPRNKASKIVMADTNILNKIEGSVQLDHDYCSSAKSTTVIKLNYDEKTISQKKLMSNNRHKTALSRIKEEIDKNDSSKCNESWIDNNSRKDSGLESGDVSDAGEEPVVLFSASHNLSIPVKTNKQISHVIPKSSNSLNSIKITDTGNTKMPAQSMKIRSLLATNILQLHDSVLTKTKSVDNSSAPKAVQMVSVLKKPPVNKFVLRNMPCESIIATKKNSDNESKKIVDQDISLTSITGIEKNPPRRKLNLAEYRNRRHQGSSDTSRTCSPVQAMTLVYIHHASTTTEPIKDDSSNLIWSEREIVSMLKPKFEVEDLNKHRLKPMIREIGTQTKDSSFYIPEKVVSKLSPSTTAVKVVDHEESRIHNEKLRYCRQPQLSSSSSSCSRSKSRSRSRSQLQCSRSQSRGRLRARRKNRSRSSNNRSVSRNRSLSYRRNTRRRRISHRRSSVSSSSSWSSRSRSRSRSYRSRSQSSSSSALYSHSRSSRSRSSSRYSSCSRSSNYRRPHDVWCHQEKKRQVEERRVIYVGRLEETITKADLRKRFEAFGPVLDISLHFREHGDNYGFVTFAYKNDAYEAVEHGNDNPSLTRYDLCFGGRRAFCKVKYADLDGMASNSLNSTRGLLKADEGNTFDLLLKEAKAKLRNRKA